MKENFLLDTLNDVDEKYIAEAAPLPKKNLRSFYIKGSAVAACACFILLAVWMTAGRSSFGRISENSVDSLSAVTVNTMTVNELSSPMDIDWDISYDAVDPKLPYDVWQDIEENFKAFTGIDYHRFTLDVPADLGDSAFFSFSLRGYKDGGLENSLKSCTYGFIYQGEDGRTTWLTLSPEDDPASPFQINMDNPILSTVNGTDVSVFSYENSFYASFIFNHVSYAVKTIDVSADALYELLQFLTVLP